MTPRASLSALPWCALRGSKYSFDFVGNCRSSFRVGRHVSAHLPNSSTCQCKTSGIYHNKDTSRHGRAASPQFGKALSFFSIRSRPAASSCPCRAFHRNPVSGSHSASTTAPTSPPLIRMASFYCALELPGGSPPCPQRTQTAMARRPQARAPAHPGLTATGPRRGARTVRGAHMCLIRGIFAAQRQAPPRSPGRRCVVVGRKRPARHLPGAAASVQLPSGPPV